MNFHQCVFLLFQTKELFKFLFRIETYELYDYIIYNILYNRYMLLYQLVSFLYPITNVVFFF